MATPQDKFGVRALFDKKMRQSAKSKRILLIDDNCNITKMFSQYFKIKGHVCVVANDGITGLQFIKNDDFDHVLLDLSMPGFGGFDILADLIKLDMLQKKNISILTASAISHDMVCTLIQSGVKNCICKPVQLDALLRIVEGEK